MPGRFIIFFISVQPINVISDRLILYSVYMYVRSNEKIEILRLVGYYGYMTPYQYSVTV